MATRDLKTLRTKENEYLALSGTHNHNSRIKLSGQKKRTCLFPVPTTTAAE
jgi:hypothetical protein